MGVSSIGYLAGKVVRKPGPVIKTYEPVPLPNTSGTVRILGENFSPRAQVWLNGVVIGVGQITAGPAQAPDSEFVAELKINLPNGIPAAAPGVAAVKLVNGDGQSAEL
jgi:hypothetical protein